MNKIIYYCCSGIVALGYFIYACVLGVIVIIVAPIMFIIWIWEEANELVSKYEYEQRKK